MRHLQTLARPRSTSIYSVGQREFFAWVMGMEGIKVTSPA
jgi:hypothetical protein